LATTPRFASALWIHVLLVDNNFYIYTYTSAFIFTLPPSNPCQETTENTRTMSISIDKILAACPNTERGRPTQLSVDPKGERIAYAVSLPGATNMIMDGTNYLESRENLFS